MAQALSCKEIHYFSQMVYRINQTPNYHEYCDQVLKLIRTLIPYKKGLVAQASREDGFTSQKELFCVNPPGLIFDESMFMNSEYRSTWAEYLFSPWSTVFRMSDIIDNIQFEKSKQYKEMYEPQDIYHGLYVTIVHNDYPLGLLGLFRAKEEPEFSAKDLFCMELLKIHLELKLYMLLTEEQAKPNSQSVTSAAQNSVSYNLSRREQEIISHICKGETDEEISNCLYISRGTLRRHVYNIYRKVNVKSRVQLIKKF